MSGKRIIGITVFGILIIAVVIGVMLLVSYLRDDNTPIPLPQTPVSTEPSGQTKPDVLDSVEVTRETVRAVIGLSLARPNIYSRDITIETFWDGGQASYGINSFVANGVTSLKILPPDGIEKRIIVAGDTLYVWYKGDRAPFIGSISAADDINKTADEWQMMITYEDILRLDIEDIIEAGYTEYNDEDCIYVQYRSALLGYIKKCYISIGLGLVIGAEEYDSSGMLVYSMAAGECTVGEAAKAAFILPDGTVVNR